MDKKDYLENFNRDVEYLKRNIPHEDIYPFAEETLMAAFYFIHKWREWVDLNDECEKDPIARKWVDNIYTIMMARFNGIDIKLKINQENQEDE